MFVAEYAGQYPVDPGAWVGVPGAWVGVPGAWVGVPGAWEMEGNAVGASTELPEWYTVPEQLPELKHPSLSSYVRQLAVNE